MGNGYGLINYGGTEINKIKESDLVGMTDRGGTKGRNRKRKKRYALVFGRTSVSD